MEHVFRGVHGVIELFLVQAGRETVLLRKKNTIVNSGMDLLAKALAGELLVNGMYLAYDNNVVPYTDPTPPEERTASFYHSVGGGTRNFVRVPTLSQPSYTVTADKYNNNKTLFVAISAGAGVLSGAGNVLTDGLSNFYGAGLLWLHATDYEQDILFSAVSFDDLGTPQYTKIAGAQFGIRWGIYFDLP